MLLDRDIYVRISVVAGLHKVDLKPLRCLPSLCSQIKCLQIPGSSDVMGQNKYEVEEAPRSPRSELVC